MSSGLDKTFRRFTDQLARPKPNSILYNRFVLYFVFFVALSNLFISAFQQNYLFCIYFILIGFILTFFHKNMTVVLVLTVAFANVLSISVRREGLENKNSEKSDVSEPSDTSDEKETPASKKKSEDESSKSEMVDEVKKEAMKLIDTQNKIIDGFEKIEPYMNQAETLISSIDATAKKIEAFNKEKVEQYKNSK